MAPRILKLLPPHRYYCEPFFGGGSIFFAKAPCEREVINDIDQDLMHFYRVLRDHGDGFIELAEKTPYHEGLYRECRETWRDEADPVQRAWKWWIVARTSFSGYFGASWGRARGLETRGTAATVTGFTQAVAMLPLAGLSKVPSSPP